LVKDKKGFWRKTEEDSLTFPPPKNPSFEGHSCLIFLPYEVCLPGSITGEVTDVESDPVDGQTVKPNVFKHFLQVNARHSYLVSKCCRIQKFWDIGSNAT